MAGIDTLQIIKYIPSFDVENFFEWARLLYDILQMAWYFSSEIIYKLKRLQSVPKENRKRKENCLVGTLLTTILIPMKQTLMGRAIQTKTVTVVTTSVSNG